MRFLWGNEVEQIRKTETICACVLVFTHWCVCIGGVFFVGRGAKGAYCIGTTVCHTQ